MDTVNAAMQRLAALGCASALLSATATAQILTNGSFETPSLPTLGHTYIYADGSGDGPTQSPLNPTNYSGIGWTFNLGSGLAQNGSAFNVTGTPDGTQVAFLQNAGSFTQDLSLAGSYILNFEVAGRIAFGTGQGGDQVYSVSLLDITTSTLTPLLTDSTTSGQAFTPMSASFSVPLGSQDSYQLIFTGFGGGQGATDETAFFDVVGIQAVPEASTWLTGALAATIAGCAGLRRKRTARSAA